jgi:hypothetical protein
MRRAQALIVRKSCMSQEGGGRSWAQSRFASMSTSHARMAVTPDEADKVLALVRAENIHTFCTRTPTEVIVNDA